MTSAVTVADIMQSAVKTVAGDTPVSELVAVLATAKVTGLPVVDVHERVIGVVSSTDLIAAQAGMRCSAEREISMDQRINYGKLVPEGLRTLGGRETYPRDSGLDPGLFDLVKTGASQLNGCAWTDSVTLNGWNRLSIAFRTVPGTYRPNAPGPAAGKSRKGVMACSD